MTHLLVGEDRDDDEHVADKPGDADRTENQQQQNH